MEAVLASAFQVVDGMPERTVLRLGRHEAIVDGDIRRSGGRRVGCQEREPICRHTSRRNEGGVRMGQQRQAGERGRQLQYRGGAPGLNTPMPGRWEGQAVPGGSRRPRWIVVAHRTRGNSFSIRSCNFYAAFSARLTSQDFRRPCKRQCVRTVKNSDVCAEKRRRQIVSGAGPADWEQDGVGSSGAPTHRVL